MFSGYSWYIEHVSVYIYMHISLSVYHVYISISRSAVLNMLKAALYYHDYWLFYFATYNIMITGEIRLFLIRSFNDANMHDPLTTARFCHMFIVRCDSRER